MKQILQSLKSRLAWYEKALDMASGFAPRENGFNWPQAPGIVSPPRKDDFDWLSQYLMYLSGCIHELRNTIDMMKSNIRKSQNKTPNGNCGYQPNDAKYPAHPPTSGSNIVKWGTKP